MKKLTLTFSLVLSLFTFANAQNIVVHSQGENMYYSDIDDVDSIKLVNNFSNFYLSDDSNVDIPISIIDSLTFSNDTPDLGEKIYIIYNDDNVTIINPYSDQGITISANNADVTVSAASGITNVEYNILGTSTNGSLNLDSDQNVILVLNDLDLTSTTTAPFNLTGGITAMVSLTDGTENLLADVSTNPENASFLSDGSLSFAGEGTLSVFGNKKHAIASDGSITVEEGTINVPMASGDAFHTEGFMMNSGVLNIESTSGDGIDAGVGAITIHDGTIYFESANDDVKAIKTDGVITVNDGDFALTLTGAQSKGFSNKSDMIFNGGTFDIYLSGATVLEESGSGYDPSYSTAIKSDATITVSGGTFEIELASTSGGGKGFSADGNLTFNDGVVTIETNGAGATYTNESGVIDSYTASCIKVDGNLEILAGTFNLTSTGIGGKGISADGTLTIGNSGGANDDLELNVTTSGNRFYVSGSGQNADYANPKAVKSEGNLTVESGTLNISCTQSQEGGEGLESKTILTINGGLIEIETFDDAINASNAIVINGGTTYAHARGNDGIDSNGTLTINGGFTIANGARMPEAGFDCDNNTFKITGGILIGTGGGTSNPTTSVTTQHVVKFNTTASNHIRIATSSGTEILAFKVPAYTSGGGQNSVVFLFSDEDLANGNYTLQRGGSISGGTEFHGYISGGSYSGGTTTNFNINSIMTTIN